MPYYDKSQFPKHLHCYSKECAYCARTFYSSKPKAKYCCNTCRAYAFQKRNPSGTLTNKIPTKEDLQKDLDRLEKDSKQSIYFRSKKSFQKTAQLLNLLRSHLLIAQPEKPALEDDALVTLLLQVATSEPDFLEKIKYSLNKDLHK